MQQDRWGKWIIAGAILAVAVAGVVMIASLSSRKALLSIGGQPVYARIADTADKRHKGLSGTKELASDEAMLFIFDHPSDWGIWMKDMNYSIDIVWLDEDKRVVHIERDVSPDTYPRVFRPDEGALYVVELPAGFASQHGLGLGQVISFSIR